MLALSASFTEAVERSHKDLVVHVQIGTPSGAQYNFTDRPWAGTDSSQQGPPSLASMASLSTELDPLTREARIAEMSLVFAADGAFQDAYTTSRMKSAFVQIKIGATSILDTDDFAPYFAGFIDTVIPRADGTYEVACADILSALADKDIVGEWVNTHPLFIVRDILQSKLSVSITFLNTNTMDPTIAANDDIRHFCMVRGGGKEHYQDLGVKKPTSAIKLVNQIGELLNAGLICGEDGVIRFQRFVNGAAAVDGWTDDDMISIDVESIEENVINEMVVHFNQAGDQSELQHGEAKHAVYRAADTASAALFNTAVAGDRYFTHSIDTPWVEGEGILIAAMTAGSPAVGGTFMVERSLVYGMCGTSHATSYSANAFQLGVAALPAYAQLDATHTAYLKIDSEIIEVDQCTVSTDVGHTVFGTTQIDGRQYPIHSYPHRVTYRVKTRGALGTTAAAHTPPTVTNDGIVANVTDITIPVHIAKKILDRFGEGAPVLRVRTPLRKYAVQLGDMVTITTSRIKFYGHSSGLDTTDKFEVCGKEVLIHEDEPCIEWLLVRAYRSSPPATYELHIRDNRLGGRIDAIASITSLSELSSPRVNGLVLAIGSGLQVEMAAGAVTTGVTRAPVREATNVDMAATSDNYVAVDTRTRGVSVYRTTVGGARPSIPTGQALIGRATTDATSVTAVADLRNTSQGVVGVQHTSQRVATGKSLSRNGNFGMWSRG